MQGDDLFFIAGLYVIGSYVWDYLSGRQINYGAVAATAAQVKLDAEPAIKTPDWFKLLGQSLNRLDVPLKVNGAAIYGIDVRLPDMLYASAMTCPVFGGHLTRHDFDAIKRMPGVRTAVEVPNGIAVVADSFWRAMTALEVLPTTWDFGGHANANSETFRKTFREALDKPGVVAKEEGDALAAVKAAAKVVEADYEGPYLAHACMEPMNCTAQVRPERVDVWVGTQNPETVLAAAAEITGVALEHDMASHLLVTGGMIHDPSHGRKGEVRRVGLDLWGRHRHDHRLCVGWLDHRAHDPKDGRRGGLGGSGGDLRRPIYEGPEP
jgi:isoquinoline 1-oxidoreductase beta subunit